VIAATSYRDEQHAEGAKQAERFIARLESGEPIAADELAQQMSIARFGSIERQRAFTSRIQAVLIERCRDA
jgi:hypothetical protein